MSSIGVFIYLREAFDTINHDILIKKLEHNGIRGATSDLKLLWQQKTICKGR